MNRRTFVKNTGLTAAGLAVFPNSSALAGFAAPAPNVRLGLIGVGLRGQGHLDNALRRKDVDVIAICDIDERMLQMASGHFKKANKPAPKIYKGDVNAWKKMLELKELDGVIIATPWEWHTPMILGCLDAGIKYV